MKPGDVLCGIETDKAVVDFEMQEQGYVAKILYPAGTKDIKLGSPVAILCDSAADVKAFQDWEPSSKGGSPASSPQ